MFIDSRDKEVKHAFALMFVEILLPVAAGANRELNVPALKGFVDMMYHHTFDLSKKTRHSQVGKPVGQNSCNTFFWNMNMYKLWWIM